jgi:outer membrane protein
MSRTWSRPVARYAVPGALMYCALCLLAGPASAQITAVSSRGFELGDALDYAMANNPALVAAAQGIEIARTGYGSADAIDDFKADGSAAYAFSGPVTSISMPDGSGGTNTFQIGKPLSGSLTISFSKPLNVGTQRRAARRIVDAQVDLAAVGDAQAKLSVLLGVKQTFYNVLLAEHLRLIALDAVDRAEAHLRIAQAQFSQGAVAQYDVDRAEADVASARAQLSEAEGGVRTALVYLSSAMGLDPSDRVEIQSGLVPEFIGVDEQAAREVAHKRPEIEQLRAQMALYAAQIRQIDTEDRAVLAAVGSTGYSIGSGFTEGTNYRIGLQLSVPIESGHGADARKNTAREQIKQAEMQLTSQTLAIDTGLRAALEQLATARASVADAAQAVVKAKDALTRVRLSYQNDLAAWIDLRDAQSGLTATEQQFVTTLFRYRLARADLENAVGVRDLGDLAKPDPQGPPVLPEMAGIVLSTSAPPIPEIPSMVGRTITPESPKAEGGTQ